jgi:hypothetical protein
MSAVLGFAAPKHTLPIFAQDEFGAQSIEHPFYGGHKIGVATVLENVCGNSKNLPVPTLTLGTVFIHRTINSHRTLASKRQPVVQYFGGAARVLHRLSLFSLHMLKREAEIFNA